MLRAFCRAFRRFLARHAESRHHIALLLLHLLPLRLFYMVVAEKMQHAVHRQEDNFAAQAMSVVRRLRRSALDREDDVAEDVDGGPARDRRLRALVERKGNHVRRTVDPAVLAVQHMDVRIVCQGDADLGVRHVIKLANFFHSAPNFRLHGRVKRQAFHLVTEQDVHASAFPLSDAAAFSSAAVFLSCSSADFFSESRRALSARSYASTMRATTS